MSLLHGRHFQTTRTTRNVPTAVARIILLSDNFIDFTVWSVAAEKSSYFTPPLISGKIDTTFKHFPRSNHPNVQGRRNHYPYHGPLSEAEEIETSSTTAKKDDAAILLRSIEPKPLAFYE
jgi:hypothetical protein